MSQTKSTPLAGSTRWQQLSALSLRDWRLLFKATILLPIVALLLKYKGYTWTKNALGARQAITELPTAVVDPLAEALHITRLVAVAAKYGPYRTNCLKKALVAQWFLQRQGICVDLKIGVNKTPDMFNAHAWLEYQGHVLGEPPDNKSQFSPFEPH
jgi:Transglutaminase-like superfamily